MNSSEKYEFFIENANQGYFLATATGAIIDCNKKAYEIFGYTREEFVGLAFSDIARQNDFLEAHLSQMKEEGEAKGIIRGVKKGGEDFPLEISSKVFLDQESGLDITAISCQDISEREAFYQMAQLREKELNSLIQGIQIGIVVHDAKDKIIEFNKKAVELLGVTEEYLLGKSPDDYHSQLFNERMEAFPADEIPSTIARKERILVENVIIGTKAHEDADIVWLRVSAQPSFSSLGKPIVIACFTDITKQIELQHELAKTTLFLEQTNKIAQIGGWEYDLASGGISWDQVTKEIHEVANDFLPSLEKMVDFYPAGLARETIKKAVEDLIGHGIMYSHELEIVTAKGNKHWVHTTGNAEFEKGKCKRLYGSFQDIHERKTAELEESKRKQEFKILFEDNPDAAYSLNENGEFLLYNPRLAELLECDDAYLKEQNSFVPFCHPDDLAHVFVHFEGVKRGEAQSYETRAITAKGTVKDLLITNMPIIVDEKLVGVFGIAKDITQKRLGERKLKESEEYLRAIFTHSPAAVFISDDQGDILRVNPAAAALCGYKEDELLKMNVNDLSIHKANDLAEVHKHLNTKTVEQGEFHFETKVGKVVHTLFQAIRVREDFNLSILTDISERTLYEQEIKKLSLIAQETINGAVLTNPRGEVTWVNHAFERITGYELSEVKGKTPGSVLQGPETDPETVRFISIALKEKRPFDVEIINYTKEGKPYWLRVQCQPLLDQDGEVEAFFAIETDITQEVESKREKEILIKELTDSNNDLKDFSYITSHNLRAPLTNLVSIADLIEIHPEMDELTKQLIEGFKISTNQLNDTLNNLVEILLLKETNQISQKHLRFDDALEKVSRSLEHLMKEKGVEIKTDFAAAESVYFAPAYLESIFQNLLTNSIRYASPKRTCQIAISSKKTENGIELVFSDNGVGFDTERVKSRLFKLFQRFHGHSEGKGMGLYLIKSQLESLGGKISVKSQPDEGTSFKLIFKANA